MQGKHYSDLLHSSHTCEEGLMSFSSHLLSSHTHTHTHTHTRKHTHTHAETVHKHANPDTHGAHHNALFSLGCTWESGKWCEMNMLKIFLEVISETFVISLERLKWGKVVKKNTSPSCLFLLFPHPSHARRPTPTRTDTHTHTHTHTHAH